MVESQSMGCPVQLRDQQDMRGILDYKVYRHRGEVKELIGAFKDENLIVNGARNQMARLIVGDFTNRNITKISFGTNGSTPTVEDTVITNAFTKAVVGFTYPAMGQVTISWNLLTSENNGQAIMEFGLVCADNTLFSRRVRANPIYKESDISIEGQWTIIY
ncbi:MAG: hypothetical protein LBO67_04870 [Spirochaetaceae bacterium]|jgi:hypothetical protein|nr:hypothetical protein [Spirochaetaceae bacterium]